MKNNKRTIAVLSALAAATMACRFGIPIPTIANPYNVTFGSQQPAVTQQSGACVQPTATSGYVEPTATQGCVQPTPTSTQIPPTSTPVYTPLDSCLGSVDECQKGVLATLHPPNIQYGIPESVDGKCLDNVEYCIQDAVMLSQQRIVQLGLYQDFKELAGVPANKDIRRAFFNFSHEGSTPLYNLYVEFGDGQTHALNKVPLTAEMMKEYIGKTDGYMVETTIRDKATFEEDVNRNGLTLEQLAAEISKAPDVIQRGYDLAGIIDALKNKPNECDALENKPNAWYVWTPNKIPCADGSNSPGMFTVVEMTCEDMKPNLNAYPLTFPGDDKLLDSALKMSEAHYDY